MRWLLFLLLPAAVSAQADPFAAVDANKDGKLSRSEVPEPLRPHFGMVDTNGDGFASKAEFMNAITGQAGGATAAAVPGLLKDIDYAGKGNPRQKLDLLIPEKAKSKKLPLVVVVHGGGWLSGRKEDGLDLVRGISATGDYAAATINYRLSQEAMWPAQIHDCKAAIRFLRANADKYGLDRERIGVMGFSAGGHLVSMLGTGNEEPSLEGAVGSFTKTGSRVQCVVNFFGPTDFLTFSGPGTSIESINGEKMVAQLLGRSKDEILTNAKLASPVTWVTRDDAPFFTAHGTKDTLVPFSQATEIHATLEKAGVESHLVAMEGAGHGFSNQELNQRVRLFLDKHLRGKSGRISSDPIRVN